MITAIEQYLSKNDVFVNNLGRIDSRYRAFQDEGPKGLMLHSVGTAQPDATVFIRSWNKAGVEKATHAFVTADTVYQTLPWNYRGWHAGGTANNAYIGVEMTEPNTIRYTGGSSWVDLDPVATEAFVRKTYANAVALFAALCRQFALDPLEDGVIISHREGYQRGIASNHGDPEHLWSKFGLQMDGFRADVAAALRGGYRVLAGTYPDLAAAKAQARINARLVANERQLREWCERSRELEYLCREGGWYGLVRLPRGIEEESLATDLLRRENVIVHPGYFYDLEAVPAPHLVFSLLAKEADFAAAFPRIDAAILRN